MKQYEAFKDEREIKIHLIVVLELQDQLILTPLGFPTTETLTFLDCLSPLESGLYPFQLKKCILIGAKAAAEEVRHLPCPR